MCNARAARAGRTGGSGHRSLVVHEPCRERVKAGTDARGAYHSFYRAYQNIYFDQNFIHSIYDARAQRGRPVSQQVGFTRRSTALAVLSIPGTGADVFVYMRQPAPRQRRGFGAPIQNDRLVIIGWVFHIIDGAAEGHAQGFL
ncbi:protein of unknown function [Cupriavidus taiwanensis]|nr:protein of unknown function [Cupriavidus taiwanensis]